VEWPGDRERVRDLGEGRGIEIERGDELG